MAKQEKVELVITHESNLCHKPVRIKVSNLAPGVKAKFSLMAIDARENEWNSQAYYIADEQGNIDLSTMSSVGGSYRGVHPMGLFWSMKCDDYHQITTSKGFEATLTLSIDDAMIAKKTFYRRSTRELDELGIKGIPKRDSIIANYYLPSSDRKVPAIIYLGGSGGGFRQERSSLLASEGFAVLNLKYFRFEGLPDGITEIPLEYVAKAHQWLVYQPEVDASNIGIMGRSMGSQLALLYAAHYDNIRYVVTEAPSNVVWFGWEEGKSSFTYQGKGFPYAEYSDEDSERFEKQMEAQGVQYHDGPKFLSAFKDSVMMDQAAIRVEDIQCPILFISGKDDMTWPSTMMADKMMTRLKVKSFGYDYQHLSYENAGHNFAGGGQGCGIPFLPPEDYSQSSAKGGTDEGNALAAAQSWTDMLAFIRKH